MYKSFIFFVVLLFFQPASNRVLAQTGCDFLTDLAGDLGGNTGTSLRQFFDGLPPGDGGRAWNRLWAASRPGLRKNPAALAAYLEVIDHPRFSELGVTEDFIARMLDANNDWTPPPNIPAYDLLMGEVKELMDNLPTTVTRLDSYFGSDGWSNAAAFTRRHSYVQLSRLIENKTVLSSASEVIFENPLNGNVTPFGNSVSDVRIVRQNGTFIEIETKAGVKFFENVPGSNFATQSANSLYVVSNVSDYKVFLSSTKVQEFSTNPQLFATAKQQVVNAWNGQADDMLADPIIQQRFADYWGVSVTSKQQLKGLLETNDDWFGDIFLSNIVA
jgi:hypothetical protein